NERSGRQAHTAKTSARIMNPAISQSQLMPSFRTVARQAAQEKSPAAEATGLSKKIPAITYSRVKGHYHRPWMLNGRVRNGNGCDHPGKLTEKVASPGEW